MSLAQGDLPGRHRLGRIVVLVLAVTLAFGSGGGGAAGASQTSRETVVFGSSVEGRPLEAIVVGSNAPRRTIVVVGAVHGDEPAGLTVTDVLAQVLVPSWLRLVVIPTVNPDGLAAGSRGNARGVDLNRNAPTGWLGSGQSPFTVGAYYPGVAPASEPETVATMAYLAALEPDAVLWYHQPWGSVVCNDGAPWCSSFAAAVGLPTEFAPRPGSLSGWASSRSIGSAVVELPGGDLGRGAALGHAAAILALFSEPAVAGFAVAYLSDDTQPWMTVELLNTGHSEGVARLTITAGWGRCGPVTEAAVAPGATVRLACQLWGPVAGHTFVGDLLDPADGRVVARAVLFA